MCWLFVCLLGCGDRGAEAPDAPVEEDIDAAFDAPRCGGSICRTDQACVESACTFACAGTKVPGDYASLQAALTALAAAGNDATICLGEATYANDDGRIDVVDNGAHGKTLTIIGLSPDRSRLLRTHLQGGWGRVALKGVWLEGTTSFNGIEIDAPDTEVELSACKITGRGGVRIAQKNNVVIDASEITTSNGEGVTALASASGPLSLRIQNSYLHGATVRADGDPGYGVDVQLLDNTLVGSTIGVELGDSTTALIVNNLFTGMSEHALSWRGSAFVAAHHNSFWNNTANYAELASQGPDTLHVDCQLGSEAIPVLAATSRCRDSGHIGIGPTTDFYNRMRGPQPDLGAVDVP